MWRGFLLGDHGRGKGDEACGEKGDVLHGRAIRSNETEISQGRVSWQTLWSYTAMGPLASSIG
jgi:hypothetical protein